MSKFLFTAVQLQAHPRESAPGPGGSEARVRPEHVRLLRQQRDPLHPARGREGAESSHHPPPRAPHRAQDVGRGHGGLQETGGRQEEATSREVEVTSEVECLHIRP